MNYIYIDLTLIFNRFVFIPAGLCSNCVVPHPQCELCMAYKQTYGNSFLKYRFFKDSTKRNSKASTLSPSRTKNRRAKDRVRTPKARARIPLSSPESSGEDDSYRAALAVSSQRRKNRPKLFTKRQFDNSPPSLETEVRRSRTKGNVRATVKELLQKNDSVLVGLSVLRSFLWS